MSWVENLPGSEHLPGAVSLLRGEMEEIQEGLWSRLDHQARVDMMATFEEARRTWELSMRDVVGASADSVLLDEQAHVAAQLAQWRSQANDIGEAMADAVLRAVQTFAEEALSLLLRVGVGMAVEALAG